MIGSIGIGEVIVIVLVILLLFGAKRVPEIARSLGQSILEFKRGMNSAMDDIKESFKETDHMDHQHPQPGLKK